MSIEDSVESDLAVTPTLNEVLSYIQNTIQHVALVEILNSRIGPSHNTTDKYVPHDICGPNNRFEMYILKTFAINYGHRWFPQEVVKDALAKHREQPHHRIWHGLNGSLKLVHDAIEGAIDTIASLMLKRPYYGGPFKPDEIRKIISTMSSSQSKLCEFVLERIPDIEIRDLDRITNPTHIGNPGIKADIYNAIVQREIETIQTLKENGYNIKRRF